MDKSKRQLTIDYSIYDNKALINNQKSNFCNINSPKENDFYYKLTKNWRIFNKEDNNLLKSDYTNVCEMKNKLYVLLKSLRMFSLYGILPYNILLICYNMSTYTPEYLLFHSMGILFVALLPYFLTENFVVKMKYDNAAKLLFVTKLNFFGNLKTRAHHRQYLSKLYKGHLRGPYAYFKNKTTNEIFSILEICDIYDDKLLSELVPDVKSELKKNKPTTKRMIDKKTKNNDRTDKLLKRVVLAANLLILGSFLYKINSSMDYEKSEDEI